MISLILTILGFATAIILLALLSLFALSGLGVIAAGKGLEWIFDVLVPARRTGLGPEGLVGWCSRLLCGAPIAQPVNHVSQQRRRDRRFPQSGLLDL